LSLTTEFREVSTDAPAARVFDLLLQAGKMKINPPARIKGSQKVTIS